MIPELSLLILSPLAGAVIIAFLPRRRPELAFPVALALSLIPLGIALWILYFFVVGDAGFQFVEDVTWSEALGVGWRLGIDGISLFLVVLTALLMPISIAASRAITDRVKVYMVSMLVLEAGLLGVFVALDLLEPRHRLGERDLRVAEHLRGLLDSEADRVRQRASRTGLARKRDT